MKNRTLPSTNVLQQEVPSDDGPQLAPEHGMQPSLMELCVEWERSDKTPRTRREMRKRWADVLRDENGIAMRTIDAERNHHLYTLRDLTDTNQAQAVLISKDTTNLAGIQPFALTRGEQREMLKRVNPNGWPDTLEIAVRDAAVDLWYKLRALLPTSSPSRDR